MVGNFFSEKPAARKELERRRRSLNSEQVARWGGELQLRLAALPLFQAARVVALYVAQSFEVPTAGLWEAARAAGKTVVLPRVVKGERVLAFHQVSDASVLVIGPLQLRQPPPEAPTVALADLDLIVVPGVGFTPDGRRLGRGGGYYDATLARCRPDAAKIGVTFACCLVAEIPTEAHDVRVDCVVSERGALMVR